MQLVPIPHLCGSINTHIILDTTIKKVNLSDNIYVITDKHAALDILFKQVLGLSKRIVMHVVVFEWLVVDRVYISTASYFHSF
jgi:hypothetical protein